MDWNPRHLYRKLFSSEREVEAFLEEIGFAEWNLKQDRGRPYSEGVAELSRRFPHHAELIGAYDTRWEESIPGAIEGTVQILRELRDSGYPVHALTNWSAEKYAIAERRFPFADWFDEVVVSGREGVCKPEPEIYRILLERIGRNAFECLFVDDSTVNVAAAAELGFGVIHFRSPAQLRSELRGRGILEPRGRLRVT